MLELSQPFRLGETMIKRRSLLDAATDPDYVKKQAENKKNSPVARTASSRKQPKPVSSTSNRETQPRKRPRNLVVAAVSIVISFVGGVLVGRYLRIL
jgi:hypothetical protein